MGVLAHRDRQYPMKNLWKGREREESRGIVSFYAASERYRSYFFRGELGRVAHAVSEWARSRSVMPESHVLRIHLRVLVTLLTVLRDTVVLLLICASNQRKSSWYKRSLCASSWRKLRIFRLGVARAFISKSLLRKLIPLMWCAEKLVLPRSAVIWRESWRRLICKYRISSAKQSLIFSTE